VVNCQGPGPFLLYKPVFTFPADRNFIALSNILLILDAGFLQT
jgi:hypothetical protein